MSQSLSFPIGCDRGIGHALARRFDRDGYKVFAGCLSAKSLEAQDLAANSVSGLVPIQMDVRDRDQVAAAATTITQLLGDSSKYETYTPYVGTVKRKFYHPRFDGSD